MLLRAALYLRPFATACMPSNAKSTNLRILQSSTSLIAPPHVPPLSSGQSCDKFLASRPQRLPGLSELLSIPVG